MTLDVEAIKRRRNIMMVANVVAAFVAVGGIMLYAQGQAWAIGLVIAAVVAGFAVQVWFMAAVRGRKGDR
jgi:uncharacterized membrane-anchored protein